MDKIEAEKMARRRRTAEEISATLEKSGFSKKEFASRMHRVPSEVTRWLSGKHNYTSDLLAEISLVLSEPISGADDRIAQSDLKGIVSGYGSSSEERKLKDNVAGSIDIPIFVVYGSVDRAVPFEKQFGTFNLSGCNEISIIGKTG